MPDLVFKHGIDESTDANADKLALTQVANLRLVRPGELTSRGGMRQELSTTYGVKRILDLGGTQVALVATSASLDSPLDLYVRNAATNTWIQAVGDGADGCSDTGKPIRVPLLSDPRRDVIWQQEAMWVRTHAVAVSGAYRCHVLCYDDATTSYSICIVMNHATGAVLSVSPRYANFLRPKVIAAPAAAGWIIFGVKSDTDYLLILRVTQLVPTAAQWPAATLTTAMTLVQVNDTAPYDVDYPASGLYYHVLYTPLGDTDAFWAEFVKSTDIIQDSAVPLTSGVTVNSVAIKTCGSYLVAVWAANGSHVSYSTLAPGEVPVVSTIDAQTVAASVDANQVAIGGEWLWANATPRIVVYTSSSPAVSTIPTVGTLRYPTARLDSFAIGTINGNSLAYGSVVSGGPAYLDGVDYLPTVTEFESEYYTNPGERRIVVQQLRDTTIRPFPALVGHHALGIRSTINVDPAIVASRRLLIPAIELVGDGGSMAVLYSAEVNGAEVGKSVFAGAREAVTAAGGLPVELTNSRSIEPVPLVYPIIYAAVSTGAGLEGHTVQYKAVFEVQDSYGRIGWSAPSPATAVLSPASPNARVTVAIPQLYLTRTPYASGLSPRYKLFRSLDGGVYYQLSAGLLARDSDGYLSVIDTGASLTANEVLYTESGEMPNQCPPFSAAVASFRNRLWSASGGDLYFTKTLKEGYLPQFTADFKVSVPARITALAPLESILLVLCDDPESTYYVAVPGDGPDDLGAGSYPMVELVSASIGCPSALGGLTSVLSLGSRAFWRSSRGIEAKAAASQIAAEKAAPTEISRQIVKTLAAYPIVRDVVHLAALNQIVWVLSDGDPTEPELLAIALDYEQGVWTTFAGSCFAGLQSLGAVGDDLVIGSSTGIWREDPALTYDLSLAAAKTAVTTVIAATLNPFGLGKRGALDRISFLGEYKSPAVITLAVALEGPGYSYSTTKTLASADWTAGDEMSLSHKFYRQNCYRLGLTITTMPTVVAGDYGAAPVWRGLSLPGESYAATKQRFGA